MEFNAEELRELDSAEASAYIKPFIESDSKIWSFYSYGQELDMDEAKSDWLKRAYKVMEQRVKEVMDFVVGSEDDEDVVFEAETGVPFDELVEETAGNTYNWGYLYPVDLNFTVYNSGGMGRFLEVRIHRGGDVRGNYSRPFFKSLGDPEEAFETIDDITNGANYVSVTFIDGSSISFAGEQSNDMDSYVVAGVSGHGSGQPGLFNPEEGNEESGIAFVVSEAFEDIRQSEGQSSADGFVEEMIGNW